jgi:hypothetical protein
MDLKTTKSAGVFADTHKQGSTFTDLFSISGGMFKDSIKIHLDNSSQDSAYF